MKKETKHIIRTLGTILFILYVLALIYFLFFSEEYGRAAMKERQYRYNLIPFVEIRRFWVYRKQLGLMAVVTNLFGNVIGFLPFGFILPVILDKMRSGWLIVLAGFGLSVTVEVIQLITTVSSAGGCFTGFICDCSFAGIFFAGTIRIYCRRDQSLRNASVCIWICDGTEKLFRRKPDTQSRYDRLYCKRNHNDRMAGNLSDGNFRLINREV